MIRNDITTLILRLLLVYAVLFLSRVLFYALNAESLGALTDLPSLIEGSLVFDTASMLYANSLFILLSLLPFRFRERGWYRKMLFWLFTVVNTLVIVISLADGIYFHYAKKRITADEMHFAGNDNTGALIVKFALERWYVVVIAALMVWGMVWCYKKIRYKTFGIKNRAAYFAVNLLVLAAAVPLIIGGIRGGFTRAVRPITLSNAGQYAADHRQASLVLSNPFCVIRTLGSSRIEVPSYFTEEELAAVFTPDHLPAPDSISLGRRNIVIFTLESFSSEHSALLNPDLYPAGDPGYTPFLDSLMRRSYVLKNAYSNGRKSIDALPAILASIPSYKRPFVLMPESLGEMEAMPRILSREGYHTAFFNGSQHNSMGFAAFANLAGVEHIYMREEYEAARGKGDFDGSWGIWDEPFLDYMAHTLTGVPQPFFATVFTLSSHHPFVVPTQYENVLPQGRTLIHKPVAYTDLSLRNFFDYARTQEWYDNTIFVFTADHVSSETFAEKTSTPTGNSQIMMFYHIPGSGLEAMDERVSQQMDIMPTLLGLIGYDKPYFAFGRDIFSEEERMPAATNYFNESYQCITDSVVVFFDGSRIVSAYERSDTMQLRDIKDSGDPAVGEAAEYLKAVIQQYASHAAKNSFR